MQREQIWNDCKSLYVPGTIPNLFPIVEELNRTTGGRFIVAVELSVRGGIGVTADIIYLRE